MSKKKIFTMDQVEKAIRKAHGNITVTAKALRTTTVTLYKFLNKNKSLYKVRDEAEENLFEKVENVMAKKILSMDPKHNVLLMFYLKCGRGKNKGRYLDKQIVEQVGETTQNIVVIKPPEEPDGKN